MAGEFEEPFSISIQAESLHSGSISFGRFENEPLAWERRSSFSHNRYLEEVEKYSKPGSVIEKKAYFEAHFRKKALLIQGSSEGQNGGEDQACESDVMENEDYREYQSGENETAEKEGYEDESDNISKCSPYHHIDENGLDDADFEEDFIFANEGSVSDHDNEGNQFDHASDACKSAQLDKGPEGSDYLGEDALMEFERDCSGHLSDHEILVLMDYVPGDVKPEETNQDETICDKPLISNIIPEKEVKEYIHDSSVNIDESFVPKDPSLSNETTWEVNINLENWKNHSAELKTGIETNAMKPRLKSPVSHVQSQKSVSRDSSKVAAKIDVRREKDIMGRKKTEKLPSQTATPTRRSMHRSPRKEDSEISNAKLNVESKSGSIRGPMKKLTEAQPLLSKKVEPVVHQTSNRLKQTANSTKADVKSSAGVFRFKSEERAERRKQFDMKLEEKMHAKEAEINQIQAKSQEKTEAEIKQLRKSLNFKAKPMPSFYNVAAVPRSTGNKAASSTMKPAKVQRKPSNPGKGASPRSPSSSNKANKQVLSASRTMAELNNPMVESSQAGTICCTGATDGYISLESMTQNVVLLKKEREKEGNNSPKHRISESSKVIKDHKIGGKSKVGGQRNSSSEIGRKNMKSGAIASNSGMGRLAVVAS